MKQTGKYLLLALLVGYTIATLHFASSKHQEELCQGVIIHVKDSAESHFITPQQVRQSVAKEVAALHGAPLSSINTEQLEQLIMKNQLIRRVECYKTPNSEIRIDVEQRHPVLRICNGAESYYIDKEGKYMPFTHNSVVSLPIASGAFNREFAQESLYPLALYISQESYWDNLVEQIYVTPQQQIELVMRVGDQQITLGTGEQPEKKLKKLRLIYEEVMPRVGWNYYSAINLSFNGQVVCTKRH